ncbi:hypothetical protein A3Q56_06661 [Intoshia linei]|uniref:Uncharacterized protein n=1 Tax=Intoshia linei TaxID=1819745 RepID=A0A177AW76_9BILA|nr:hypothetical protein A3Q56_06661 [Intoshia linei]
MNHPSKYMDKRRDGKSNGFYAKKNRHGIKSDIDYTGKPKMNDIDYKNYFLKENYEDLTFLLNIESDFIKFVNDEASVNVTYDENLYVSLHIKILICKLAECWGFKVYNNVQRASITIFKCADCKVPNFCIKDLIDETRKTEVKDTNQPKIILERDENTLHEDRNNKNELKGRNSQKTLAEREIVYDITKKRIFEKKNEDIKSESNSMDENEIEKMSQISDTLDVQKYIWISTRYDQIPNNAIMINPDTFQPYLNEDGTFKRFDKDDRESNTKFFKPMNQNYMDDSKFSGHKNFPSSEYTFQDAYQMQQIPPNNTYYPEMFFNPEPFYNNYISNTMYPYVPQQNMRNYNSPMTTLYVSPSNQNVNNQIMLPPNNIVNQNFPVVPPPSIKTLPKKIPEKIIPNKKNDDKQIARTNNTTRNTPRYVEKKSDYPIQQNITLNTEDRYNRDRFDSKNRYNNRNNRKNYDYNTNQNRRYDSYKAASSNKMYDYDKSRMPGTSQINRMTEQFQKMPFDVRGRGTNYRSYTNQRMNGFKNKKKNYKPKGDNFDEMNNYSNSKKNIEIFSLKRDDIIDEKILQKEIKNLKIDSKDWSTLRLEKKIKNTKNGIQKNRYIIEYSKGKPDIDTWKKINGFKVDFCGEPTADFTVTPICPPTDC